MTRRRAPGLDGLSKGIPLATFDPVELARGAEVELEHTSNYAVAKRIAADHLTEDPHYYKKLARMERNPVPLDEPVVSEAGELCTIKDCCVVICDGDAPIANPSYKPYLDRNRLNVAYEAVRGSTEKLYGWDLAEGVYRALLGLPVHYNPRLTRAIGRAKFRYNQGVPVATEIEITSAYEVPESYMLPLLVHESCHVARCVIAPDTFRQENPHGPSWSSLMVMAGQEPRAQCIDPEIDAQVRKRKGHPEVALGRADFAIGDRVSFSAGKKRGVITGKLIAKAENTATIADDAKGTWRVGYGLLTKETTP